MLHLDKNMVPAALRAGYNGARFRAEPCESMTIHADAGLWSGGTRDSFSAFELATGRSAPMPGQSGSPWSADRVERSINMRPGYIIVKHSMFCGKDMGLTFYIHPADVAALIPAQNGPELSDRELKALAIVGGVKSSYRADEFARQGYKPAEVETIKARLLELGLIDKRGAITTAGRNARGDARPY
jgi:hypothetical protein